MLSGASGLCSVARAINKWYVVRRVETNAAINSQRYQLRPRTHSFTLTHRPFTITVITARCYASAVFAVMQCMSVRPSVRPSVTFVDHVKTNKHIFEIFSSSNSDTILVFLS